MTNPKETCFIVYVINEGQQVDKIKIQPSELRPMGMKTKVKHSDEVCVLDKELAERLFKWQ